MRTRIEGAQLVWGEVPAENNVRFLVPLYFLRFTDNPILGLMGRLEYDVWWVFHGRVCEDPPGLKRVFAHKPGRRVHTPEIPGCVQDLERYLANTQPEKYILASDGASED